MRPETEPETPARIQVTSTDLGTGESETVVITDDYVLTCAGSCYVSSAVAYKNGTQVLTIKGRRNGT